MKNTFFFLTCLIMVMGQISFAQGVAINTDNSLPHPSAILDVSSLNKGILIPRMSTAQRNAIGSPAEGLKVYDIDYHTEFCFSTLGWIPCGAGQQYPQQNETWTGPVNREDLASEAISKYDLVMLTSNGWERTDFSELSIAGKHDFILGIALEAVPSFGSPLLVALPGAFIRNDEWSFSVGSIYPGLQSSNYSNTNLAVGQGMENFRIKIGDARRSNIFHFLPAISGVVTP